MKRSLLVVLLGLFIFSHSHAQKGELSLNLGGGYMTKYKNPLYGLNIDYNVSDHFQISLSEWVNPWVSYKGEFDRVSNKYQLYATNLDARFLVLHMRDWAMGISLGGQYLTINDKNNSMYDDSYFGFNLGVHLRANITDNMRATAGWKWTTLTKDEPSYHLFYLTIGYAFELF